MPSNMTHFHVLVQLHSHQKLVVLFFYCYSKSYRINIRPDHNLAIFSYFDIMDALSFTQQETLMVGMIAAKKMILIIWKSSQAPCYQRMVE